MDQYGSRCLVSCRDGDVVTLENQDGFRSDPIHVRVTERIRDDCASMVHGFGSIAPKMTKAHRKGTSDTKLITRIVVDPIMGRTACVEFCPPAANEGKG